MYVRCRVSGGSGLFIPNCLGDMYQLPYWLLWQKQLKAHSLKGHPMQPKHGSKDSFSCSSRRVRYWSHCVCSQEAEVCVLGGLLVLNWLFFFSSFSHPKTPACAIGTTWIYCRSLLLNLFIDSPRGVSVFLLGNSKSHQVNNQRWPWQSGLHYYCEINDRHL